MAAGVGKRMRPLTLTTPKPLIEVNGVRMIDSVINGLNNNGINEIYVVIGYLKEKFYEWAESKTGIKLIENPYYDSCNNISSLYVARSYLSECIILDGDQFIYNDAVLEKDFSISGYNAVWCEDFTDEWLMDVEDSLIKSCSRNGGKRGWQLYSISRWSFEDGEKLRKYIEYEFESGNRDIYWDDVPMFLYFNEFRLGIREMNSCDVKEIDSIYELSSIDKKYVNYV